MIRIILVILFILAVLHTFIRCNPKIDIILSNGNYVMLLWYTSRNNKGNYVRVYKKLFTF